MRAALTIAWTDLKILSHDKSALFWIFVGPLLFVTFFGEVFRERPPQRPVLMVVNHDADDTLARGLSALLDADGLRVEPADAVTPGRWTLEVPAGAAASFAAEKPLKPVLHLGREESNAERSLSFKVYKAWLKLYLSGGSEGTAGAAAPAAQHDEIVLKQADLGVRVTPTTSGFQRSVPAYLVMFLFLNLVVGGADLAEERATGRLRRIFSAPVPRWSVALGKLLARLASGWIQAVWLLGLGVLLFKVRWAEHPFVLVGFLTVFALASAGVGLLFGTLFEDPSKCVAAAIWSTILLSPLGGLWWPLEIVGPKMRAVASFVPTGWGMQGVNALLAFGAGARDVAPYALALLGLFVVTFGLAARRLKP